MTVLVTGGAGYIGSHVVRLLLSRGDDVVIVDDLSNGIEARVDGVPLVQIDISTDVAVDVLTRTLIDHDVEAVIHFAAKKQVGESVARPAWYYKQNVGGMANLLIAMERAGVTKLVLSSSAATYGQPDVGVVTEDMAGHAINPYGETKVINEWMGRHAADAWGLRFLALRYFNVAGAGWPELGDVAALNLVPMVFDQLSQGSRPKVFGDDYPTPDGSCVRDYVHVLDLARAHLAALDHIARAGGGSYDAFNVGTGHGTSVKEVIRQVGLVTGLDTSPEVLPRRAGDPAQLVCSTSRIESVLGWRPSLDIGEIVSSAWGAWQRRGVLTH